jgi:hypothetical protein
MVNASRMLMILVMMNLSSSVVLRNPFRGVVDDIAIYQHRSQFVKHVEQQLYHDQQPLIVISPSNTDRYPKQSTCQFEWKSASTITSIDLAYSLDGGVSWNNIIESLPAANNEYTWQLPDWETGTAIHVRLRDSNNSDHEVMVGPFYISEYHWVEVNNNCEWLPRDGAGVLVFQDKMWLLGGWNPFEEDWLPGYTCNEVWHSVDGAQWTYVGDAPWQGKTHGRLVGA